MLLSVNIDLKIDLWASQWWKNNNHLHQQRVFMCVFLNLSSHGFLFGILSLRTLASAKPMWIFMALGVLKRNLERQKTYIDWYLDQPCLFAPPNGLTDMCSNWTHVIISNHLIWLFKKIFTVHPWKVTQPKTWPQKTKFSLPMKPPFIGNHSL